MKAENLDLNRFENLVTEREKLSSLSAKVNELEEAKRKLEGQITQVRKSSVEDQAERLLAGTFEIGRDFYKEIQELDNEIEVHRRAVELQDRKLRELKSFCSKKVCDGLQDDYQQVVRKMRDASRAMLQAIEIEQRFIDELQRNDVEAGYLGRVFFPRVLSREALEAFIKSTDERCK